MEPKNIRDPTAGAAEVYIVTVFKFVICPNAYSSIVFTEAGMLTELNPVNSNDSLPILVTVLGIVTDSIFNALINVSLAITLTAVPIFTDFISIAFHPTG